MKHIIYNIRTICALALGLMCNAASAQILLGYCGDKISLTGASNATLDAEISCAMALTPAMLQDYTYCNLPELQFGLSATEGLTSMRVWVRHHLTDKDLASAEIKVEELQVGWNQVALNQAVEITGQDTLYCGYSYTQESKVKCISSNGSKKTANSFYISNGKLWGDYSANSAPVSIRASLSALYDNAMRLTDIRLDRRSQPFISAGSEYQPITISGTMQNIGGQPLQGFDIACSDNGQEAVTTHITCESVGFGEYTQFSCQLMPGGNVKEPACDIPITISLSAPNQDAKGTLVDCEQRLYYELWGGAYLPNMCCHIVEEFTSEACGYAPIGQERLRKAIEEAHKLNLGKNYKDWKDGYLDGYYTHYEILSRHEGYGPADHWRVNKGSDFRADFFGPEELTFAPAMMVDRKQLPLSTTLNEDSLASVIASCSASLQPVTLEADMESIGFDEKSRTITATVTATLWAAAAGQDLRIVLCAKQYTVPSYAQKNYYPERYNADEQLDVVRCYLNCSSGSNALYPGIDMEKVITGQMPVSEVADIDKEGHVTRTFTFEGVLPASLKSPDGLAIVGYVYDQRPGGQILGAFCCHPFDVTGNVTGETIDQATRR